MAAILFLPQWVDTIILSPTYLFVKKEISIINLRKKIIRILTLIEMCHCCQFYCCHSCCWCCQMRICWYRSLSHLTDPTMNLSHIPQYSILWQICTHIRGAHMCTFLLQNAVLWHMGQVNCWICVRDPLSITFLIFFAMCGVVCIELAHKKIGDREHISITRLIIITKSKVSTFSIVVIFPLLCARGGCGIICCRFHIYAGNAGLFLLLLCSLMLCANDRVNYGPMVVFVCLLITLPHYHHYADVPEGIEFLNYLCVFGVFEPWIWNYIPHKSMGCNYSYQP